MNGLTWLGAAIVVGVLIIMGIIVVRAEKEALKGWGTTLVAVIATGLGTVLGYFFQQQYVDAATQEAQTSMLAAESARQVGLERALRFDSAAALIRGVAEEADSIDVGFVIDPARFAELRRWAGRLQLAADSTVAAKSN